MRFIHTGDWHLGNRMHNIDRKKEYDSFLFWLKNEIENQKAETLVIAGDIFDTANPPTEARTQYNKFLASLLKTCCQNVIIVGGNHDSGVLLDSEKEILKALNIHVVGTLANLNPEDMVFELKKDNEETGETEVVGICAAVPYAHEIELRRYYDKETEKGQFSDLAYAELYKQVYAEADKLRAGRNIPIIGTGHLYAANLEGRDSAEGKKSDDEVEQKRDDGKRQLDVVGNLGSVHIGAFPEGFDYVALGHIHYPTMVAKNPKVRYSGSPFILGFDEHNIKHSILSVEITKGTDPKTAKTNEPDQIFDVKKIEVPETVIYKRITGKCSEIEQEIQKMVEEWSKKSSSSDKNTVAEKEINIEVNYNWEDGVDINEVVERMNGILPPHIAIVHKKHNEEQEVISSGFDALDDLDVEDLTFEDIFRGLILEKDPVVLDPSDKTENNELDAEKIKELQEEKINRYLPDLLAAVDDYEKGIKYEDK